MSKIYHLLFLPFFLLWSSFSFLHPIHISISEVSYSEKDKSLQVMHKIFYDDLENDIERIEKAAGREVNLRLGLDKEHPQADEYIRKYVENHFKIVADSKTFTGTYLGKEFETDAVWIYIEIEKVKAPKKLELSDTILMDLHEDQSNFVHFNIANQKKSLRFQKGNERQQVSF